MKAPVLITHSLSKEILICAFILIGIQSLHAQRYDRKPSRLYASIEVGTGTRPITLRSNVADINNLHINEEGFHAGLMLGGEMMQARIKQGIFHSSETLGQKIDLNETNFSLSAFPLRMMKKKSKYIKPYVTGGLGRSSVTLNGSYVLPEVVPVKKSKEDDMPTCHHEAPGDPGGRTSGPPLADPDLPAEPKKETTASRKIGTIHNEKFTVGAGVYMMLPVRKHFFSMYAEANYGVSISQRQTVEGLAGTSVGEALFINLGVGFGLRNR